MLGLRVSVAESNRPVVPVVVLVPDPATYLREIGRWTPKAQWPVLIEDSELAPMFIRAFKPRRVLRVPAASPLPTARSERESAMQSVVVQAWGGTPEETTAEIFAKYGWQPPGVAVTDTEDTAWPAAVAIAAARGLPLTFLTGNFERPGAILGSRRTRQLEEDLRKLVAETGYQWSELGDSIDAVAICRSLAARTSSEPQGTARSPYANKMKGPYAVTDSICRHDDGTRWAIAGWIWGSEIRTAYMAMSSIFLSRSDILFFNGYDGGKEQSAYEVTTVAEDSQEIGFQTTVFHGKLGTLASWLNMVMGGINADVLFANSSGHPEFFNLAENTRGDAIDVPLLNVPLAMQLIHSFSLQRPTSEDTVGGRFLDHGVYAYIGSVEEPYLAAFVPPSLYMKRLSRYVPFLVAGRSWVGPFSPVWRLTAIGDPLMLVLPPSSRKIALGEFPDTPDAVDLLDVAQQEMRKLKENPDGTRKVIETLVLLGRDKLAAQVWNTMCGKGNDKIATQAASVALGPLFRTGEFEQFIRAYDRLPLKARTARARDMLWHISTPRLSSINEPNQIALLLASVRSPDTSIDLARLMPHLDRVLGDGAGRSAAQKGMESANSAEDRAKFKRLMN